MPPASACDPFRQRLLGGCPHLERQRGHAHHAGVVGLGVRALGLAVDGARSPEPQIFAAARVAPELRAVFVAPRTETRGAHLPAIPGGKVHVQEHARSAARQRLGRGTLARARPRTRAAPAQIRVGPCRQRQSAQPPQRSFARCGHGTAIEDIAREVEAMVDAGHHQIRTPREHSALRAERDVDRVGGRSIDGEQLRSVLSQPQRRRQADGVAGSALLGERRTHHHIGHGRERLPQLLQPRGLIAVVVADQDQRARRHRAPSLVPGSASRGRM